MCMLGCLSNLVVVGVFKEKTFPLAVARTGAVLCPPLNPPSLLPLSCCLKAEGETLYTDEGFGHFSAESR